MPKILVVDDDAPTLSHLARAAVVRDAQVLTASSTADALRLIDGEHFDVIVTDLRMGTDDAGLDVLKAAKDRDVYTQVIVITAMGTPEISVRAMYLGAFDYLEKSSPGLNVLSMLKSKIMLALEFRDAKLKEI